MVLKGTRMRRRWWEVTKVFVGVWIRAVNIVVFDLIDLDEGG